MEKAAALFLLFVLGCDSCELAKLSQVNPSLLFCLDFISPLMGFGLSVLTGKGVKRVNRLWGRVKVSCGRYLRGGLCSKPWGRGGKVFGGKAVMVQLWLYLFKPIYEEEATMPLHLSFSFQFLIKTLHMSVKMEFKK
ncbi:hypothetical protein Tco_1326802 [Tanacetum coccineum]